MQEDATKGYRVQLNTPAKTDDVCLQLSVAHLQLSFALPHCFAQLCFPLISCSPGIAQQGGHTGPLLCLCTPCLNPNNAMFSWFNGTGASNWVVCGSILA